MSVMVACVVGHLALCIAFSRSNEMDADRWLFRFMLAAAAEGEVLDKRLWTAVAALTGAKGNSTALVGTPEQVAEALLDYHELGITTFLIRGFDPLADAIDYGRKLIPLTRELIAERVRTAATAAE